VLFLWLFLLLFEVSAAPVAGVVLAVFSAVAFVFVSAVVYLCCLLLVVVSAAPVAGVVLAVSLLLLSYLFRLLLFIDVVYC